MLLNKEDEIIFNFNPNYYTCLIDLSKYSHLNIFVHHSNIIMSFKTTELKKTAQFKRKLSLINIESSMLKSVK